MKTETTYLSEFINGVKSTVGEIKADDKKAGLWVGNWGKWTELESDWGFISWENYNRVHQAYQFH